MFDYEFPVYLEWAGEFLKRLENDVYGEFFPFQLNFAASPKEVAPEQWDKLSFAPAKIGERWGAARTYGYFHFEATIPPASPELALVFHCGSETLICTRDGKPVYSLTGGSTFSGSYTRCRCVIPDADRKSGKLDYVLECFANIPKEVFEPGKKPGPHPYAGTQGVLKLAELREFRREVWELARDVEIVLGIVRSFFVKDWNADHLKKSAIVQTDFRQRRFLEVLSRAADVYCDDPANAAEARACLKPVLSLPAEGSALTCHAVGHAHIDTAWTWPFSETIRKCKRTFAVQLAMIRKYPEYVFGASTPRQYEWIEERYPELFAQIREAVRAGRWELQGGMYVESDANLPCGEALIRQFLYGKRYFREKFGVEVRNVWLPDCFGFSPALPQIALKSGCPGFLTHKLMWSQFNRFPYHSFRWRGLDGSELLSHFPPEDTYNGLLDPVRLHTGITRFAENDRTQDFVSLFGQGDGGVGPNEEMIARGIRMKDQEFCPKVKFDTVQSVFDRLESQKAELPVWDGELYLEYHRGTLTSQAAIKKMNRRLEQLLIAAEYFASLLPEPEYPHAVFDDLWKRLLLNQFHDVLPGSCNREVNEEVLAIHSAVETECRELLRKTAEKLFRPDKDALTLVNTLPETCEQRVILPPDWPSASGVLCQAEAGQVTALVRLAPFSSVTLRRSSSPATPTGSDAAENILENDLIRYEFSADGLLVRAYDKENGREWISAGTPGNALNLYQDKPLHYDAWEMEPWYPNQKLRQLRADSVRRTFSGPAGSALESRFRFGESTLVQKVVLAPHSRRLDFRTQVDWHEKHKLLRVEFPVSVRAHEAAYAASYGYQMRPTHDNLPQDRAQFEAALHQWEDLSDAGSGVALLNDCKYGGIIKGNVISLSLLRAPTSPDPLADQGEHDFTYSLLPHVRPLADSCVMAEAASLNRPFLTFDGLDGVLPELPVRLDSGHVRITAVKRSTERKGLVLRLAECSGKAGQVPIALPVPGTKAALTDLLERKVLTKFDAGPVTLDFSPFELKTLFLCRKDG